MTTMNCMNENKKMLKEVLDSAIKEYTLYLPDDAYVSLMSNGGLEALSESILGSYSDSELNDFINNHTPEYFFNDVVLKINEENVVNTREPSWYERSLNYARDKIKDIQDGIETIQSVRPTPPNPAKATQVASRAVEYGNARAFTSVVAIETKNIVASAFLKRVSPMHLAFFGLPIRGAVKHKEGEAFKEAVEVNIEEYVLEKAVSVGFNVLKTGAFKGGKILYDATKSAGMIAKGVYKTYGGLSMFTPSVMKSNVSLIVQKSANMMRTFMCKATWARIFANLQDYFLNDLSQTLTKDGIKKVFKEGKLLKKTNDVVRAMKSAVRTCFTAARIIISVTAILEFFVGMIIQILIDYALRKWGEELANYINNFSAEKIQEAYTEWVLNWDIPTNLLLGYFELSSGTDIRALILSLAVEKHLSYVEQVKDAVSSQTIEGNMQEDGGSAMLLGKEYDVDVTDEHLLKYMDSIMNSDISDDGRIVIDLPLNDISGYKWKYDSLFGIVLESRQKNKQDNNKIDIEYCLYGGLAIMNPFDDENRVVYRRVNVFNGETRTFDKEFDAMYTQLLLSGIDIDKVVQSRKLMTDDPAKLVGQLNAIYQRAYKTEKAPYCFIGENNDNINGDVRRILVNGVLTTVSVIVHPIDSLGALVLGPVDAGLEFFKLSTPDDVDGYDFVAKLLENSDFNTNYKSSTPAGREFIVEEKVGGKIVYKRYVRDYSGSLWEIVEANKNDKDQRSTLRLVEESECKRKYREITESDEALCEKDAKKEFLREYGWDYSSLVTRKVDYAAKNEIWHFISKLLTGNDSYYGDFIPEKDKEEMNLRNKACRRMSIMRNIKRVGNDLCVFVEYLCTPEINEYLAKKWYSLNASRDLRIYHNKGVSEYSVYHELMDVNNADVIFKYTKTAGYKIPDVENITWSPIDSDFALDGKEVVVTAKKRAKRNVVKESNETIDNTEPEINTTTKSDNTNDVSTNDTNYNANKSDTSLDNNKQTVSKSFDVIKNGNKSEVVINYNKYDLYTITGAGFVHYYIIFNNNVFEIDANNGTCDSVTDGSAVCVNGGSLGLLVRYNYDLSSDTNTCPHFDVYGNVYYRRDNGTFYNIKNVTNTNTSNDNTNTGIYDNYNPYAKRQLIINEANEDYSSFLMRMAIIASMDGVDYRFKEIFARSVWRGARYYYELNGGKMLIDEKYLNEYFPGCTRIVSEKEVFGNVIVGYNL